MTRRERLPIRRNDTYARQTLRPIHSLLFILPMLAFFHVGAAVYGSDLLAPRDIDRLLGYFNATLPFLPAVVILAVLLAQHALQGDRWRISVRVLGGMLGESAVYILPLIAMGHVTGRLWTHQAGAGSPTAETARRLCVAVGAGVYEEFVFRLVLIGLLLLVFVDVFELKRDAVIVVSVILAALAFSAYHVPVSAWRGEAAVPWYDTFFRALAGVYLGLVYVLRGYGIAAGTHAIYNIYAVTYHM